MCCLFVQIRERDGFGGSLTPEQTRGFDVEFGALREDGAVDAETGFVGADLEGEEVRVGVGAAMVRWIGGFGLLGTYEWV